VALDTDIAAARPFHEVANATHPSLVDPSQRLVELFGITNVPFALWVDETGRVVRPAEVAFLPREPHPGDTSQEQALARAIEHLPPDRRAIVEAMTRNSSSIDRTRYVSALRDWAANGPSSPYALSPDDVISRSRPRPPGAALAAAHFEMGQWLHATGHKLDAVPHFQAAHRHDPENWSYARQAYSLVDESMGNPYGTDLLAEVARVGVDTFYPPLNI
jgi:hypothetical protein